jgi:LysM repeat protein
MKRYSFVFLLFMVLCPQLSCAGQEPARPAALEKKRMLTSPGSSAAPERNATNHTAQDTKQNNKSLSNGGEFEQRYPSKYRVKKGETLVDIARRREIFNDPYLWPLIYKANRDQIRDPQVIFPGQQLTIPRDITREDMLEARTEAKTPPSYTPPRDAYGPDVYRKYFPAGAGSSNSSADNQSSTTQ